MATFSLITEGLTDQPVIENILVGLFNDEDIEVNPLRPLGDATYRGKAESYGNWSLVLKYCESSEFAAVFQFPDNYVVIHIDTDVCEEKGFDVPRQESGGALPPRELINKVAAKLQEKIGPEVWEHHRERIILAIAVDSIECWLLPLYTEGRQKGRHLNCLETLNRALTKKNQQPISSQSKDRRLYDAISRPYSKQAILMRHYKENASLEVFIENLLGLKISEQEDDQVTES